MIRRTGIAFRLQMIATSGSPVPHSPTSKSNFCMISSGLPRCLAFIASPYSLRAVATSFLPCTTSSGSLLPRLRNGLTFRLSSGQPAHFHQKLPVHITSRPGLDTEYTVPGHRDAASESCVSLLRHKPPSGVRGRCCARRGAPNTLRQGVRIFGSS